MRCSSPAHAPKSISRQRSEQKGRNGFAGVHLTRPLQVGQLIILDGSDIVALSRCAGRQFARTETADSGHL